ncbi:MAG: response regulator [Opitutae bacterium]|nr:response regulator [Opitutae bacterium]
MKILVADDHATNRKLLGIQLEAEGHTILEASDGREALALLERETVDAIISDILMPNMDGFLFCHEVRRNKKWHNVPIIIYTATYTSPGDEKLARILGADKYLRKPSTPGEIMAALHDVTRTGLSHQPAPAETMDELTVMRDYNARLVDKLEDRNIELESATARLEKEKDRFRQLADHIDELFWVMALDRRELLYASPAYEKIMGRPLRELQAKPAVWFDAIWAEDRPLVVASLERIAAGENTQLECRIVRPDGTLRWVRSRGFPVRDEDGAISRCVGILSDITERKVLEEKFRRAQRLEAIGMLSSGVSHDLNNILAPILMAAGLLKAKLTEPRDRDILALVERGRSAARAWSGNCWLSVEAPRGRPSASSRNT